MSGPRFQSFEQLPQEGERRRILEAAGLILAEAQSLARRLDASSPETGWCISPRTDPGNGMLDLPAFPRQFFPGDSTLPSTAPELRAA